MTDRNDDDTDDRDLERLFARRRERSARPDAIAALWERVEDRIATTAGQDEGAQPAGHRSRRAAAGWFGAGFAVAAAIASLIAVSVGSAPPADRASGLGPRASGIAAAEPNATSTEPSDDDVAPRLDDSSRAALADAERAYEHALDVVEADYRAKRDSLPPDVAVRIDASFRDTQRMRDEARDEAGDDVDARLLLLDTYAVQLHTLQSALDDID